MKFIKSKKGLALLATLAVAIVASVGAYAYFTSAGTGSGTAAVGTNTTSITIAATITDGLVPGSSEPVSYTALNGSPTTTGWVGTISLASVTDPAGAAGCIAYLAANQADFSFTVDPQTETTAIHTGVVPTPLPNDSTLNWANSDTADQTPCVGETLTVNVTSA